MKLAAVIVHFGNPEASTRLLERFSNYDIISNTIVVIHDDSSFPDFGSSVVYLKEENKGYAAGINRGLRYLMDAWPDIDLVLALNPDVWIEESQILDLLDQHISSNADCTFPALSEGKYVIHGYRFSWWGTMRRVKSGAEFFPGACFLFSVMAWKQVEGLDESYFHYFEDVDFCLRLQHSGGRIHHAPEILVQHLGKSGADYPATALPRYAVRNHLLFLRKIGKLNPLSFCNVVARHLFYLLRWKRGWRGIRQWLTGIREFWVR